MSTTGPQHNDQNHDKAVGGDYPDKPSQAEGEDPDYEEEAAPSEPPD